MKVRMLIDQDSAKYGELKKGEVYDLEPKDERAFIARGIAELSSKTTKKKKTEVSGDGSK